MKARTLLTGLILGLFNFIYLAFLLLLALTAATRQPVLLSAFLQGEYALYSLASVIFILIFSQAYAALYLKDPAVFLQKPGKKKLPDLAGFLFFSLLLTMLFAVFFRTGAAGGPYPHPLFLALPFLMLGSWALRGILRFFSGMILFNLFFPLYQNTNQADRQLYRIYGYDEFVVKAIEIANHARRFSLSVGFIILYIPDLAVLEDPKHRKFIRKQLNFLFTENSRNYEPWSRSAEKDLYLKILETTNRNEFMEAAERFSSIFRQNQFYILNRPVALKVKMLHLFLDNSFLRENENRGPLDLFAFLRENCDLLKSMNEEVRLIDLK